MTYKAALINASARSGHNKGQLYLRVYDRTLCDSYEWALPGHHPVADGSHSLTGLTDMKYSTVHSSAACHKSTYSFDKRTPHRQCSEVLKYLKGQTAFTMVSLFIFSFSSTLNLVFFTCTHQSGFLAAHNAYTDSILAVIEIHQGIGRHQKVNNSWCLTNRAIYILTEEW